MFLGRFHPVILHLPIALILLVPLLEGLGLSQTREHLRRTAGLVLGLAAAAAVVASWDGWLLAWAGGYQGPVVLRHMYGGAWFAALAMAATSLRGPNGFAGSGRAAVYGIALAASVGVMVWTSHNGGSLSHGPTFLTEYLPTWLGGHRKVEAAARRATTARSGGTPLPRGPRTVYLAEIKPILDRSCVSCHGPNKVKGGLRLDTYAGLMAGGDSGDEIDPWLPGKSELMRRITLPPDDDDFMPNNGKNLLTPAEIGEIRAWIAAGASDKQPVP